MNTETGIIEHEFLEVCGDVGIRQDDLRVMMSLLQSLRDKNVVTHAHYLHSLRVGIVASSIGRGTRREPKPLLFAGALHDVGKALTPIEVLGRSGTWTEADRRIIRRHVMDSYRLLRGRFDFTAEVILWHHRFQERGYPKILPKPLHKYCATTKRIIVEYGRLLALADVYDALHRPNGRFKEGGALSGAEVREKMFEINPDQRLLVAQLYEKGIFRA